MSFFRKITAIVAIASVPVLVSVNDESVMNAAAFQPATGPVAVAGTAAPALALPPSVRNTVPVETPLPMMQFPPAKNMQFHPAPTMTFTPVPDLQIKPAGEFIDGAKLYQRHCSECHGQVAIASIRGITFSQLSSALINRRPMAKAAVLPRAERHAIIEALR